MWQLARATQQIVKCIQEVVSFLCVISGQSVSVGHTCLGAFPLLTLGGLFLRLSAYLERQAPVTVGI